MYHQNEVADHKSLLKRQSVIEDRKEYIEHALKEGKIEYDKKREELKAEE